MAGKLIDIFQNCKCVKEEKHLAAGEVRSLAFGDNNTVMVVELGLHEVVSRKVIARAEKQIADTYGLDRVMIEPRYNMTSVGTYASACIGLCLFSPIKYK